MPKSTIPLLLIFACIAMILIAGCTSSSSNTQAGTSTSAGGLQVQVLYSGNWTGAYGGAGSIQSVDGTGPQIFTIANPDSVVSANFQKGDSSSDVLTVEIIEDGQVIKSANTSAAYGTASVSASQGLNGAGFF